MELTGKTAIITGAVGGIGSAVAALLTKEGAQVHLLDVRQEPGAKLEGELRAAGYRADYHQCDVTSEKDWAATVQRVVKAADRIDILVNNAGISIRKPIEEMSLAEWNQMMLVNAGSVFLGIKYVLPTMRRQKGGSIINMSSICGLVGHKYTTAAYTASKGAVTLLTKSVASRYAEDGVRVNSVHPSTVHTSLVEEMLQDPEKKRQRLEEIPLGRLATLDDVANCVLFLASDKSSFLTGIALPVDGGLTAY